MKSLKNIQQQTPAATSEPRKGKRERSSVPPSESIYGNRGSSPDELVEIVTREISTISTTNAGAHEVWIPKFLEALERTPNWSLAARVAGVDKSTPSKRADSDPEFAAAAQAAEGRALDLIEAAAFKSAVYGDLEPVYHEGIKVGEIVRYSHQAREMLLKAGRPQKYRERLSLSDDRAKDAPVLTLEDRRRLVLELLPSLPDYARLAAARPVQEVEASLS